MNARKQLNVSLPEAIYRYATGQAKLSGMSIKEFVQKALVAYGKQCESERACEVEIIELQLQEKNQ